ncbi:MAG: dephospho-CoA kinase [Proteobacteria bacterium]|nr:dephospho-CoA kinase [Pseudomonadota bacterium]
MLTIGLTGGIASGKTTISNLFSSHGVPVIDTDILSRHLLDIDQPGYREVVQHFGNKILQSDRQINRRQLRVLVFSDKNQKKMLETLLHPMIFEETQHRIAQHSASYIIVVIPLLFKTRFQSLVDRTLVVNCSESTQIERLISRDDIEIGLAREMIAQQWSNEERLSLADDIIDNDRNHDLETGVASQHKKYLSLSYPTTGIER